VRARADAGMPLRHVLVSDTMAADAFQLLDAGAVADLLRIKSDIDVGSLWASVGEWDTL